MKKYVFSALLMGAAFFSSNVNAQIQDEKSVTMTMDLQPVLQLNMETPDQVEFVFDDINDYYAGITKYGGTILKVSSTVSWDLYAVGRSNGSIADGFWDQQIDYGADNVNAVDQIPLSALELHQNTANPGAVNAAAAVGATFIDYSQAFVSLASGALVAPNGGNSLYYDHTNFASTPPAQTEKYIAGHSGAGTDFVAGGSYLTAANNNYYYVIDYRILPGLPATFPMAFHPDQATGSQSIDNINGAGFYAEPGVYTMYVQYILLEDQ